MLHNSADVLKSFDLYDLNGWVYDMWIISQ